MTIDEAFRRTLARDQSLRQTGKTLVTMWEHEWDAQVKADPTLRERLDKMDVVMPMDAREAFFGGRYVSRVSIDFCLDKFTSISEPTP